MSPLTIMLLQRGSCVLHTEAAAKWKVDDLSIVKLYLILHPSSVFLNFFSLSNFYAGKNAGLVLLLMSL